MKVKGFTVEICPISLADIIEVKRLEKECGLSPWSINDYYAELDREDSITLTAKVKGQTIGFITARLIKPLYQNSATEIEIYNVCIASEYRRKGIGSLFIHKLLNATEDKIGSVWLEVRESNKGAISFYSSLGFSTTGIRKNFYRNPVESGLIMNKSLTETHFSSSTKLD